MQVLPTSSKLLKELPQVEELLQRSALRKLEDSIPHTLIAQCVRESIDAERQSILSGKIFVADQETFEKDVLFRLSQAQLPSLRPAINASGIILHTNLGRSVLAEEALQAVQQVAQGYSTLEYDPQTLSRGSRQTHCEKLICSLTGAESAMAVNNNAAAVLLVLSEFAAGRETILSRGESVEIGGSFRIPDIMKLSNTNLIEVGTTNKSYKQDYEKAITENTALLMKVHPSNFHIIGFTNQVNVQELKEIAEAENKRRVLFPDSAGKESLSSERTSKKSASTFSEEVPLLVYEDQGSGALLALECFKAANEPRIAASLKAGCDLVSFSGDKLLGGPQAGIIVGSKQAVDRLKANPLARVLRLDKMSLAALETTLRLYLDEELASTRIPTLEMLTRDSSTLKNQAEALRQALEERLPHNMVELSLESTKAQTGGGSLPGYELDSYGVKLNFLQGSAQSCKNHLSSKCKKPVVVRIQHDAILCDVLTLRNALEVSELVDSFTEYFESLAEETGSEEISVFSDKHFTNSSTVGAEVIRLSVN